MWTSEDGRWSPLQCDSEFDAAAATATATATAAAAAAAASEAHILL